MSNPIYREIKHSIGSGEIASLSKEQLLQFHAALAQSQAYTHFSASQFPQICNAVELHLAARLQEHASNNGGNKSGDDKWYKKPIGIIGIGLTTGTLVLFVRWLLGL